MGQIAPDEKITVYITSKSIANLYEWRLETNLTPLYGQRASRTKNRRLVEQRYLILTFKEEDYSSKKEYDDTFLIK